MPRDHGPWHIQSSEWKYQNAHIAVREDQVVQPDGQPGIYATVTTKRGVSILPVDDQGQVHLLRQFRYALGRESLEAASGGLREGEPFLQAAQRELREEMGMTANEWTDLGRLDLDTSIIYGPVRLYLARGLSRTEVDRDGTETMQRVRMPLEAALRQVVEGTLTHGPSCTLLLKAWLYLHGPETLRGLGPSGSD